MTLNEARVIARIIETADGNCHTCVRKLAELCAAEFPQFKWDFDEKYVTVTVTEADKAPAA